MTLLKKFTVNILILTLGLAIAALALYFIAPQYLHFHFAAILILIAGIHYLSFYVLFKKGTEKANLFINLSMIMSMGKMLLIAAIIAIYGIAVKEKILLFTATTLLLYLVFLIFDVLWLLKLNKSLSENTKK